MLQIQKSLKYSPLFKGFKEEDILDIIEKIYYKIYTYSKNETIAIEGDDCNSIGIILSGSIEVQKIYPSGKTVTINRINKGGIFGEVIVFSNMKKYPSTIISIEKSEIMFISKNNIIELCRSNSQFLNNFMEILSKKILMLNNKLRNLSFQTIRQKIANFLLDEYIKQKNLIIKTNCSRKEMAEQFGVPRPSLSRELIKMKDENIIDFHKDIIKIKDLEKLESCLF